MSNKENEKPREASPEDPLADTSGLTLTGDSTRRGSPQFLDTERCGRCRRSDDGSRYLGRRENSDGHRHAAAAG